jgi:hypothetical protein
METAPEPLGPPTLGGFPPGRGLRSRAGGQDSTVVDQFRSYLTERW